MLLSCRYRHGRSSGFILSTTSPPLSLSFSPSLPLPSPYRKVPSLSPFLTRTYGKHQNIPLKQQLVSFSYGRPKTADGTTESEMMKSTINGPV